MVNSEEIFVSGEVMSNGAKVRLKEVTESKLIGMNLSIGLKAASNYSLVIEATSDPNFFSFYSPDLKGFTGVGHSVEDCIYKARWGMEEHVALLKERGLPVPKRNPNPKITIQNEPHVAAVG